jgi:PBP1b-binding outer membrane lipoprotein LpoB
MILLRKNEDRQLQKQNRTTQASNNFEIYYSNCVWKVDPAIRFIEGKVTHYITVNSSTNFITFDLSKDLMVDSVRLRNQKLNFVQANNDALVFS